MQDRHSKLGFLAPLSDRLSFACLKRGVLKVSGAPRALCFPIQRSHVVALLRLAKDSLVMARDVLLVVLMTVCCLRPSEVVGLQLCDLLFDFDCAHSNDPSFQGTAAVLVRQRKND